MLKKSTLRLTFEALPFHGFVEKSWKFVRNPEIVGENLNNSSLRYAGQNFIASLFLVTTIVVFFQYLFPMVFEADFSQLINPVYLSLLLAAQAIVFSFIVAIVSSILLAPKKLTFHYLIGYQVVQAYAVLNFLVVVMFWLLMNRILKTDNINSASNSLDFWLGGSLGILTWYLFWRLLINPLWNYIVKYYTKKIAFGITAIIIIVSFWVNSYTTFRFSEFVINKPVMCKHIYKLKKERGELSSTVDEQCFIGKCLDNLP